MACGALNCRLFELGGGCEMLLNRTEVEENKYRIEDMTEEKNELTLLLLSLTGGIGCGPLPLLISCCLCGLCIWLCI